MKAKILSIIALIIVLSSFTYATSGGMVSWNSATDTMNFFCNHSDFNSVEVYSIFQDGTLIASSNTSGYVTDNMPDDWGYSSGWCGPPTQIQDQNWDSYAWPCAIDIPVLFPFNFTENDTLFNEMRVKHGFDGVTANPAYNISIGDECQDPATGNWMFRGHAGRTTSTNTSWSVYECFNQTSGTWDLIGTNYSINGTDNYGSRMYDQEIYHFKHIWNVPTTYVNVHQVSTPAYANWTVQCQAWNGTHITTAINSSFFHTFYLYLYFEQVTNVSIVSQTENPVNYTMVTSLSLSLDAYRTQRMYVLFNPSGSGDWQQLFAFYNYANQSINETLGIFEPDLNQNVRVMSSVDSIEGAWVCSQMPGINPLTGSTEWLKVFCDFTNQEGVAYIYVNDMNDYIFTASHDDYTTTTELHYIPPLNSDVIMLNVDPTTITDTGDVYFWGCGGHIWNSTNCTLSFYGHTYYSSICINYTTASESSHYCEYNTNDITYDIELNDFTEYINATVIVNGNTVGQVASEKIVMNVTADVDFDITDSSGVTLYNRVSSNRTYLLVMYILIGLFGIVFAMLIENLFKGMGLYGYTTWLFVMAMIGFWLLFVPLIPIIIHIFLKNIMPMLKTT